MTRELKPYPEYKDSGVEWIGEIPSDWELIRLKHFVGLKNNSRNTESLPYIGLENIESKTGIVLSVNEAAIESQSIKFMNGDVLFGKLRPYLAKVTQVNFTGHCSTEFLVMTPKNDNKKYLMYLMLSANFISVINSSTYGTKMPRASWGFIGNIKIPRMKKSEEMEIVRFLNQKTSEIDSLIADKEKLIALLEEKRQAVITETVTKGLDPNVKMKGSGIDWIGEVPEHWDIAIMRRIIKQIKDGTHGTFNRVDEGKPLLSAKNIYGNTIHITDNESLIDVEDYNKIVANGFPQKNDLLMTIVGTIGRVSLYHYNYPLAFQRSVAFLRFKESVLPEYYLYFTQTISYCEQLMCFAKTSAQSGIYMGDILKTNVIVPPFSEQEKITLYLSKRLKNFDSIINRIKKQISKLKEYRESLIYEAVTGKIDLRNYEVSEKVTVKGGSSIGD